MENGLFKELKQMDYNYILQNLEQEKFSELKEKLLQIQGIKELDIILDNDKVKLCYNLEKNISEYDIFVQVDSILQQENIDISFEDEKPLAIKEDATESKAEETKVQENLDKKKKGKLFKLPDYTFRLAQIVLAVIFYLIFSDIWVVTAITLVLASYEIFYDTLTDIFKKKITDNVVVCLSIIILSLLNQIGFAFMLACGFGVIKVISMAIISIFRQKNYELCYVANLETADGQEIELESVQENQLLNYSGKVFLKCEITDGQAEVKRASGQVETLSCGDILYYGDQIAKKQTLVVKTLESFESSGLKDKKDLQKSILEQADKKGLGKKESIVYICLAIASLLYIFIKPAFAEYYLNGLVFDSVKAVTILAFSFPLVNFWCGARQELLIYKLNKNITFTNLKAIKSFLKVKGFVYTEGVFLSSDGIKQDAYGMLRELKDLGVLSQTAIGDSDTLNDTCDNLKLKNRLNATSGEEYENLVKDSLLITEQNASINNQELFSYNKDEIRAIPKTVRVTKRANLLKKLSTVLGWSVQIVAMVLSLSGLVSIGWCMLGGLILTGLLGLMQLFELVEL